MKFLFQTEDGTALLLTWGYAAPRVLQLQEMHCAPRNIDPAKLLAPY